MDTKKIFMNSPFWVKNLLVDFEAFRRDKKRRGKLYKKFNIEIDFKYIMESGDYTNQSKLLNKIILDATKEIPAYKGLELTKIEDFPVLDKNTLRNNYSDFINEDIDLNQCIKGSTSGSTGSALTYYTSPIREAYNYLYADKFLDYIGCSRNEEKVRISNISIVPINNKKPPFWVYIKRYHQLQFSTYHISNDTVKHYCDAMISHKVKYGTGYPSAWIALAEYIQKVGLNAPSLKAIVTDGEGMNQKQKQLVEDVFNCKVFRTYGLSETGQFALECLNGNYHVIPDYAFVETLDNENFELSNGEGEIVVTTLCSTKTPLIRYRTGDVGKLGTSECGCGMKTQYLTKVTGRLEDYILYKGRKIGSFDGLFSDTPSIIAAQLVQSNENDLLIRIVPNEKFTTRDMDKIIKGIKNYVGEINVRWEQVTDLERSKNGKVKFVIRKF
jgi:phenylacetate-CoA ligase